MLNAHQKVSNGHSVSVVTDNDVFDTVLQTSDHGTFNGRSRDCRLWPLHLRFLLTPAPAGAGDRHHV